MPFLFTILTRNKWNNWNSICRLSLGTNQEICMLSCADGKNIRNTIKIYLFCSVSARKKAWIFGQDFALLSFFFAIHFMQHIVNLRPLATCRLRLFSFSQSERRLQAVGETEERAGERAIGAPSLSPTPLKLSEGPLILSPLVFYPANNPSLSSRLNPAVKPRRLLL